MGKPINQKLHDQLLNNQINNGLHAQVTITGNKAEIKTNSFKPNSNPIVVPYKNNQHINKITGEITPNKVNSTKRVDNTKSLKRSAIRAQQMIASNFYGDRNELWITLTYSELMTDPTKASNDFKNLIKNYIKPYFQENNLGEFKYIYFRELQDRGAWHIHFLIKAPEVRVLEIPFWDLLGAWGKGGGYIERLHDTASKLDSPGNLGRYVIGYMVNLSVSDKEAKDYKDNQITVDGDGKQWAKWQKIKLYPARFNIYQASQNCEKPKVFNASVGDIKKDLEMNGFHYKDFKVYEYDLGSSNLAGATNLQTWSK